MTDIATDRLVGLGAVLDGIQNLTDAEQKIVHVFVSGLIGAPPPETTFALGDRVKFSDNVRPKYLKGNEGAVIAVRPGSHRDVQVRFDKTLSNGAGRTFRNPAWVTTNMLEPV